MTKYITLAVWGNKKSHTKKHFTLKPAKRARSRNYRPRERHEQHEEFSIWNRWAVKGSAKQISRPRNEMRHAPDQR